MISRLLNAFSTQTSEQRRARRYRDLIRREAQLGGQLFGPIPKGGRREFFCLDRNTWVWHEEWIDQKGVRRTVTTRYDVRPHGIFKAQDGQPYQPLDREEALRFREVVLMYGELTNKELYAAAA